MVAPEHWTSSSTGKAAKILCKLNWELVSRGSSVLRMAHPLNGIHSFSIIEDCTEWSISEPGDDKCTAMVVGDSIADSNFEI